MWRLIGITLPQYEDSKAEKQRIISLLESKKIEYFHIRKPDFSFEQMSDWLKDLPLAIRKRLSLHDCLEVAKEFQIGGEGSSSAGTIDRRGQPLLRDGP